MYCFVKVSRQCLLILTRTEDCTQGKALEREMSSEVKLDCCGVQRKKEVDNLGRVSCLEGNIVKKSWPSSDEWALGKILKLVFRTAAWKACIATWMLSANSAVLLTTNDTTENRRKNETARCLEIEYACHRKRGASGEYCTRKWSLFTVRIIKKQTPCGQDARLSVLDFGTYSYQQYLRGQSIRVYKMPARL
jgi:hypothetical protein